MEGGHWRGLVENVAGQERVTPAITELQARAGYGNEFLIYVGRGAPYSSSLASDGYATGLRSMWPASRGCRSTTRGWHAELFWLKRNQRASGRWFTPSQGNHTQHYISNAGTASPSWPYRRATLCVEPENSVRCRSREMERCITNCLAEVLILS